MRVTELKFQDEIPEVTTGWWRWIVYKEGRKWVHLVHPINLTKHRIIKTKFDEIERQCERAGHGPQHDANLKAWGRKVERSFRRYRRLRPSLRVSERTIKEIVKRLKS